MASCQLHSLATIVGSFCAQAVDTFLKIAKQCKEKFVVQQAGEPQSFIKEMQADIHKITLDLDADQVLWCMSLLVEKNVQMQHSSYNTTHG